MRKTFSTSLLCLFTLSMVAQGPVFQWVKGVQVLGTGFNNSSCESIKVDSEGNVITAGYFKSTSDFDPGPGTLSLNSNGHQAGYIQKLDASGDLLWAMKIGSAGGGSTATSIALDSDDNVYCTGWFVATVDFDPGPGVAQLTSMGTADGYILKLNADGTFGWVRQIRGASTILGWSIAVDGNGGISAIGEFFGTAEFDPGPSSMSLTSVGYADVFIAKLDLSGDLLWAKQIGSPVPEYGLEEEIEHTVDLDGNILITGFFYHIMDLDPGAGTNNVTASGSPDLFVVKLDPDGVLIWAERIGSDLSSGSVYGNGIASDASGNVYITGSFDNSTDFDPGPGVGQAFVLADEVFVLKLDANGDFAWVRTVGGSEDDSGIALVASASGEVYVTGGFEDTAEFDDGPGSFTMTAVASIAMDVFIMKLGSAGDLAWAVRMGSAYIDYGNAITIDDLGNVYTLGMYRGAGPSGYPEIDFDPGPGTAYLPSTAELPQGFFVQKLAPETTVGLSGDHLDATVRVHPNPTNGDIRITLNGPEAGSTLRVHDMTGRLLLTESIPATKAFDHRLTGPAGVYVVEVISGDGTVTNVRVVKH